MAAKSTKNASLSVPAKRCLTVLLGAELDRNPVELHTWRARNAKKIPLLEELRRDRAIEGDIHCVVTFWGLMNAHRARAEPALSNCERVFKALRKHYPRHPKEPIKLSELARQTKLTPSGALQGARFLSRSPLHLSIGIDQDDPDVAPHEQFVTIKGFDELKELALDENRRARNAVLPSVLLGHGPETTLGCGLGVSESNVVRECWAKAVERVYKDPEGAITAARSLLEAACKHVIEDSGESNDKHLDLPALYKRAAALLKFDPRPDVAEPLRRVLSGCANVVGGIAELRNHLGDAHGKGASLGEASQKACGIHCVGVRGHVRFVVSNAGRAAHAVR